MLSLQLMMAQVLATGHDPLVFDEAGNFEAGDGMRLTLFPHHLLIESACGDMRGHMLVDLSELLDAMTTMTEKVGN